MNREQLNFRGRWRRSKELSYIACKLIINGTTYSMEFQKGVLSKCVDAQNEIVSWLAVYLFLYPYHRMCWHIRCGHPLFDQEESIYDSTPFRCLSIKKRGINCSSLWSKGGLIPWLHSYTSLTSQPRQFYAFRLLCISITCDFGLAPKWRTEKDNRRW